MQCLNKFSVMDTLVRVIHLRTQRTAFFKDIESFFNQFFDVWPVKDYGWKSTVINIDISECSSSIIFTLDEDYFLLSFEKLHVTNKLNYIS